MNKSSNDRQLSLFSDDDFISFENHHTPYFLPTEFNHAELFERLSKSPFRSSFHLTKQDKEYIWIKGLETIHRHAIDFITKRLAPAIIPNDGKQTPMKGHPVFRAQHATGCCCRGCLYKWHNISKGKRLTDEELRYVVSVLMTWIEKEYKRL